MIRASITSFTSASCWIPDQNTTISAFGLYQDHKHMRGVQNISCFIYSSCSALSCYAFSLLVTSKEKTRYNNIKGELKRITYQYVTVQIVFQFFQTWYPLQEVRQGEANTIVALKRVGPSSSSWLASCPSETWRRLVTIDFLPFRLYRDCVNNPRGQFPKYLNYWV